MMASLSSSTTFMFTFALFAIAVSTVSVSANKINVDNWFLPYAGPKTLDAKVGETIVFEWGSGHNVFIHPTMNCELDGAIAVGSESPALYTFTEADSGTDMFFSCDIGAGAHCQNGQNLVVTVSAAGDVAADDSGATDTTPTTTVEEEPAMEDSGSVSGTSFYLFSSTIAVAALLVVLVAL